MTKGLESLSEEIEKINSLFDQYPEEMRYLRHLSEHALISINPSIQYANQKSTSTFPLS